MAEMGMKAPQTGSNKAPEQIVNMIGKICSQLDGSGASLEESINRFVGNEANVAGKIDRQSKPVPELHGVHGECFLNSLYDRVMQLEALAEKFEELSMRLNEVI